MYLIWQAIIQKECVLYNSLAVRRAEVEAVLTKQAPCVVFAFSSDIQGKREHPLTASDGQHTLTARIDFFYSVVVMSRHNHLWSE